MCLVLLLMFLLLDARGRVEARPVCRACVAWRAGPFVPGFPQVPERGSLEQSQAASGKERAKAHPAAAIDLHTFQGFPNQATSYDQPFSKQSRRIKTW